MRRIELGCKVKVRNLEVKNDPETEYYLSLFKDKVGTLVEITKSSTGVPSFHVEFPKGRDGIFHENEIELVTTEE